MMLKKSITLCLAVLCLSYAIPAFSQKSKGSFYHLKIYHLKDKGQEAQLDKYLEQAYLPALHRAGIGKVGVFKSPDTATVQKLYVFIPFKSGDQFFKLDEKLQKDKQYIAAAKDYLEASPKEAPYARIESILMEAFAGMPGIHVPQFKTSPGERVYELRSYEAATEKLHLNKVDMFNKGEIQIFEKLGFNAVFYGRVIAGSKMPNLMYMTSFENMAARDAHWKTFVDDPDWKKMSKMPEYANNVSHINIYLLHPTAYSDL